LLKSWPEKGPAVVWRAELGETYAAPSILGGMLVLFHRLGDEEVVEGVEATTGKKKWRFSYPTAYQDRFGYCNGPRSAPTLEAGKAFVLGVEGKLHALDLATGQQIWNRSLQEEYFKSPLQNFFGVGVAPRIEGNEILLNLGDERLGCVTAIDKATGKTVWRSGEDGASYSTALAAQVGKSRLAFFLTREGAVCARVADGTILWTYPFRAQDRFSANAASPILIGDQLFLTAAYGVGSALLKVDETGCREVWRNKALSAHWATPIHRDGYVYGFDGRHDYEATLRCVRLSDGQVMWARKGYERGSMTLADGKFIILSEGGRLVLADLTPQGCQEISSALVLSEHCWQAPVLSRGLLYLLRYDHRHGKGTLLCLDLRERK
jgi:outer membrane protein assembly factor BamB